MTPMLARSASDDAHERMFADGEWLMSEKFDGVRVLATATNGGPTWSSRSGRSVSVPLSIMAEFARIGGVNYVLDGELVDGVLHVFDGYFPDFVPASASLLHRQAALASLFDRWSPDFAYVRLVSHTGVEAEKRILWDAIVHTGGEGVVWKHVQGDYVHDYRSGLWLKYKLVATVDVVVLDANIDDRQSASVGVQRNGEWSELCTVSTMWHPEVAIGDVVTVRYVKISDDGRLVQPVLLGVRGDKPAMECDSEQLVS